MPSCNVCVCVCVCVCVMTRISMLHTMLALHIPDSGMFHLCNGMHAERGIRVTVGLV